MCEKLKSIQHKLPQLHEKLKIDHKNQHSSPSLPSNIHDNDHMNVDEKLRKVGIEVEQEPCETSPNPIEKLSENLNARVND